MCLSSFCEIMHKIQNETSYTCITNVHKKVVNSVFDLKKGGVFVQDAVNSYVIKINSTQSLIDQFDNSPQQCNIFTYSLSQVTVSVPFKNSNQKTHIYKRSATEIDTRGKTNISLTLYLLLPGEIYMNENNLLQIFIIGNVLNIKL